MFHNEFHNEQMNMTRREGQWGPMSGGSLYGQVQCIMGNGHMGPPPPNRMIDMIENITFP